MAKQPSHNCERAGELSRLQAEMEDLNHIIKGNGQEGLQATVIKLSVNTTALKDSVDDLNISIKNVNRFMSEMDGGRKETERKNAAFKWIIGTLLIVITILFGSGLLNNSDNEPMKLEKIDGNTMYFRDGHYQTFDSAYWNDSDNPLN